MTTYRAAIIGCGRIGVGRGTREGADLYYTHAGSYVRHPQTVLVAAADAAPARLEMCRRTWGVERLDPDYRSLLQTERPDIVSICVPDELHYPVVDAAIEAGVRAIFCEKPFTLTSAQAHDAVRRCAERGIVLAVNHHRRWEPGHRRVRAAIADGALGEVQQVRSLYYGELIHVGTHLVDLLRFFFGEVASVEVLNVMDPGERSLDFRLGFEKGIPAVVQACRRRHYAVFEVDILGSRGRVQFTNFGHQIQWWRAGESAEYPGDIELQLDPRPERTQMREAFLLAVDDIVRCLASGGEPLSSGREAARTMEVLERVLAASRT